MKLEGVFTALVTPMTDDGKVDEKSLRKLVDFQIEGGVQGLVPAATTGESPTLDGAECKRVIQVVVEQARGRVPVIGGAGSNNTKEAIHYAREAKEVGVDATLQVTPYYNKPTNDGILAHFRAVADAVDLPLIALQHCPDARERTSTHPPCSSWPNTAISSQSRKRAAISRR